MTNSATAVGNQVSSISYDSLWSDLNDGAIQQVKESFNKFNEAYENLIYQNLDLRALQKMLYTTNIKSISWTAYRDITSDEEGVLASYYWTETYVTFNDDSGVTENDWIYIKAECAEDLAFILKVLNVDMFQNIPAFGLGSVVELNHSAMVVNSDAMRGGGYTMSFLQFVQKIVNREIAVTNSR